MRRMDSHVAHLGPRRAGELPRPAAIAVADRCPGERQVPVAAARISHAISTSRRTIRLVRELTAERDDVSTTLGLPPSEEKIHVYLFHDAATYSQILARKFPMVPNRRAFFVETDTRLDVYAHWSDRVAEDLRHEVAHGYLHSSVPAIPLWLDEGLAEYFEVPRSLDGLNRPHLQLLSDLMEHNGWQPDLRRARSASHRPATCSRSTTPRPGRGSTFCSHSTPERRELLTDYLAELRDKGIGASRSRRGLATASTSSRSDTLAEFLVDAQSRAAARRHCSSSLAKHVAVADGFEAELAVHGQRRRVALHRLRFDHDDAAVLEPVERLAQQKRGQPFAPRVGDRLRDRTCRPWRRPSRSRAARRPRTTPGRAAGCCRSICT